MKKCYFFRDFFTRNIYHCLVSYVAVEFVNIATWTQTGHPPVPHFVFMQIIFLRYSLLGCKFYFSFVVLQQTVKNAGGFEKCSCMTDRLFLSMSLFYFFSFSDGSFWPWERLYMYLGVWDCILVIFSSKNFFLNARATEMSPFFIWKAAYVHQQWSMIILW